MKRIGSTLCLLLVLTLLLTLCACSNNSTDNPPTETAPATQEQPGTGDSTQEQTEPADPTQEQTEDTTQSTAPPEKTGELVGSYRCVGVRMEDQAEYQAPPYGYGLQIYDEGAVLYCDDFIYNLSWTLEGEKLTAVTVDEFSLPFEGTVKAGVLEAFFDDVYFRFEKKTEQEIADEAVSDLRYMMDGTAQEFAVAYLGWMEEADSMQGWIEEKCPDFLQTWPFVPLISGERIIGNCGEVFCLVPRDPDATVSVNLMQDSPAGEEAVQEVLYRAESSEPILLVCNGGGFYPDTQVVITGGDGKQTVWYPQTGGYGLAVLPTNEEQEDLAYDYSYYHEVYPYGYNIWLNKGWKSVTEDFLTGTCWNRYYDKWQDETLIEYLWTLNLSSDGIAQLYLMETESAEFTVTYTGTWSLDGVGELGLMSLDLTCEDGKEQLEEEVPDRIAEEFTVLRSPEGDRVLIGIQDGQPFSPIFTDFDEYYTVWWGSVG